MIDHSKFHDSAVLSAMFSSAGEGLIVADSDGIICMANPRMTELFGYTLDELLGQSVDNLIPRDKKEIHRQHRKDYAAKPKKRSMGGSMNLSGLRKDGSEIPIEVSLNHFVDNDEFFVMAMITDISVRKKAEQELHDLNLKLESLVDIRTKELDRSQNLYFEIARNFPKGTINVFDSKLNYIFVEGEDLYKSGIKSERLVGTNYLLHLPEQIRGFIEAELKDVFEGQKKSLEVSIPKGTYLLNCAPLPETDGSIKQILVVEQNITQQKKAEEDAQVALSKEKELSELKSRFVSMASHEFRTPLSTIMSSANLIDRYEEDEQLDRRRKHVHRIKSNVKTLTSILNDFLSISKLEEGIIGSHPTEIRVQDFLTELTEEMQEIAKEGQTIYLDCSWAGSIFADKEHFKNIMINLVSNAIKYSSEGDEIHLCCIEADDEFSIEVKDQGIGIPETEQKRLFERFYRANNATNIQGTGLGLYIVRRYAELMGGRITFKSEFEKGSVFTVHLPKQGNHGV